MEAGVDVLIEKPLAPSLAEADELIRLAQRTSRIGMVGHLERLLDIEAPASEAA